VNKPQANSEQGSSRWRTGRKENRKQAVLKLPAKAFRDDDNMQDDAAEMLIYNKV